MIFDIIMLMLMIYQSMPYTLGNPNQVSAPPRELLLVTETGSKIYKIIKVLKLIFRLTFLVDL